MRKLFKVVLDCDDVLFMCNETALQKLNGKGHQYKLTDINHWGILGNGLDERLPYFEDPEFISQLPLYPGAKEFVRKLSKRAEVVIATNVPAQCAGARIDAIVRNFPEIKISNILIGGRKDLLNADMMLDDAPQNLEGANVRYPVLFRQPWNYGKTGLLSVSAYHEFLTLVDMVQNNYCAAPMMSSPSAVVLVGPSGSGKKQLAEELSAKFFRIQRVASYATKGGFGYHSISTERFNDMDAQGMFFETSSYMGHRFGTIAADVQSVIDQGNIPLLIMDINGMLAMKCKFRTLAVFVKLEREQCIRNVLTRGLGLDETVQRIAAIDTELLNEGICDMTTNQADTIIQTIQYLQREADT